MSLSWNCFVKSIAKPNLLFFNTGYIVNCMKEVIFSLGSFDVGVNQKRIGLWMDVFHHNLKTIEKNLASVYWTSRTIFSARFSFTMPSLAAKRAVHTCFMKWRSSSLSFIPVCKILHKINFLSRPETLLLKSCKISRCRCVQSGKSTKRLGLSLVGFVEWYSSVYICVICSFQLFHCS